MGRMNFLFLPYPYPERSTSFSLVASSLPRPFFPEKSERKGFLSHAWKKNATNFVREKGAEGFRSGGIGKWVRRE